MKNIQFELTQIVEKQDKKFEALKNSMLDYEIEVATSEDFPDLKSRLVKIKKLRKESDPKKFVRGYKRLTGATDWDLPDELIKYTL